MLHLQRIRKERVFGLVQMSCACFVLALFGALGGLLTMALAPRRLMWKLAGAGILWCGVGVALFGIVFAIVALLAMRQRHFPRGDRWLARVALALNGLLFLGSGGHHFWFARFLDLLRRG